MEKEKQNFMNLNRETAMRLWTKSYGKETKVVDFAGRVMVKGAYNDRNSDYGWNVDHILPQSQGGKTADYNLICCHILTNDEKANKFPCFVANSTKFEILKVENHYEIKKVDGQGNKKVEDISKVNYFDSASGIRFFKGLRGIQNKPRFVGSVLVRLKNVKSTAVIDFIENFFDQENISYSLSKNYYCDETRIIAKNYNMPTKLEIEELLDKCVLLNTYFEYYFMPMNYIDSFEIIFRLDHFAEKEEMYLRSQHINFSLICGPMDNTLYINNLVIINTEAKDKVMESRNDGYVNYNYVFTKLSKNLEKEVKK